MRCVAHRLVDIVRYHDYASAVAEVYKLNEVVHLVCRHGVKAENFFSILKTECIYRTKIATLAEARELIDDYIYFYNNQRIQTKTKLTPMEFRCQYVA